MKTSRILTLLAVLLLAFCLAAPAASADAAVVRVSSAQELLAAIAPDTVIELEPGQYNLSQAIDGAPRRAGTWLRYESCWEGAEAVVHDLDSLTLRGLGDVEIVVEPRAADVLRFEYCSNVTVENITLGHTIEPGVCTGDVLEFAACSSVTLSAVDLYGCGTYGVVASNSRDLSVENSTIRECSYGLMDLNGCSGVSFVNCDLRDCGGYNSLNVFQSGVTFDGCRFEGNSGLWGFLSQVEGNSLRFNGCSFGAWESAQVAALTSAYGELSFDENCSYAEQTRGDTVTVTNAEEFFNAIAPGATVFLQPGRYDLGAWIAETWAAQGESWNAHHPYVRLQECYDGVEAVVTGADGLNIIGLGRDRGETELVVEARYADVLGFVNCSEVALANLTLGHTDGGDCSGAVVYFENVGSAVLTNLDLYGCGMNGIDSYESGPLTMRGSTIRECSAGPVYRYGGWGEYSFEDCVFTGSDGGFTFWECPGASFLRCVFGATEYASIAYDAAMSFQDCWY